MFTLVCTGYTVHQSCETPSPLCLTWKKRATKQRMETKKKRKRRRTRQKGSIFPLAALIPALIAGRIALSSTKTWKIWNTKLCYFIFSIFSIKTRTHPLCNIHFFPKIKMVRRNTLRNGRWRPKKRRRRRTRQRGGILPVAALIPALIAGGKAIGLAAAGASASYGVNKALDAASLKRWYSHLHSLRYIVRVFKDIVVTAVRLQACIKFGFAWP